MISENPLGENSFASPAISQGQIFIRGENHLFAIDGNEDTDDKNNPIRK